MKHELKLRIWPDIALRVKELLRPPPYGEELKELTKDMFEVLAQFQGVGLAAPQVGLPYNLAVCYFDGDEIILGEPTYKSTETPDKETSREGCLSLPYGIVQVERLKDVIVSYKDVDGNEQTRWFCDQAARAVQHECDHLKGTLIKDYASPLVKGICEKKARNFMKHKRKALELALGLEEHNG
jgi:peptide deformylase